MYSFDDKDGKRLTIGPELSFGAFSDSEVERLQMMDNIWTQVVPRYHLRGTRTWKDPYLYNKVKAGTKKKKEEL